jgi:hypothetical protein
MPPAWSAAVEAACQAVFTAADAGFAGPVASGGALLWEADPVRFAARYPGSRVVESYGRSWPPPCIDFWVYADATKRRARLVFEGWNEPDVELTLTGDPDQDATTIAAEFARVLRDRPS